MVHDDEPTGVIFLFYFLEFLTVLACELRAECLQSCRTSSQGCEVLQLNNCILLQRRACGMFLLKHLLTKAIVAHRLKSSSNVVTN